jgi:Type II secretion system (T2SS), protein E, N-terminal domain
VLGKRLENLLVTSGLLDRAALERNLAELEPGEALADHLIAQGALREADLLRAVAQAAGTKFISSTRLAELRVGQDVLDRIQSAEALKHAALPIAFDSARKALTVVVADAATVSALDHLPDVARAESVLVIVALPQALTTAIHRLYRLHRAVEKAPPPEPVGACSHCGEAIFEEQLECGHCGLLLNPDAPVDRSEQSIVRALLAQPSRIGPAPKRESAHDGPTRLGFAVPVTDDSVPEISGNLDILRRLTEFEAFLVSWVDGVVSLGEISNASGLMGVEVRSMVASLSERGVLRLLGPPPAAPIPLTEVAAPAAAPIPLTEVSPPAEAPLLLAEVVSPAVAPAKPARPAVPAPVAAPPRAPVVSPPVAAKPTEEAPAPRRESRVALEAKAARQRDLLARFARPEAPPPAESPKAPPAPAAPVPSPARPARPSGAERQTENAVQHALALERRGDVEGAIRFLTGAIAKAPNPAPLYNRLAVVLLNRHRDAQQAERLLHKAIELEPENPVYRQNLLKVLQCVG